MLHHNLNSEALKLAQAHFCGRLRASEKRLPIARGAWFVNPGNVEGMEPDQSKAYLAEAPIEGNPAVEQRWMMQVRAEILGAVDNLHSQL